MEQKDKLFFGGMYFTPNFPNTGLFVTLQDMLGVDLMKALTGEQSDAFGIIKNVKTVEQQQKILQLICEEPVSLDVSKKTNPAQLIRGLTRFFSEAVVSNNGTSEEPKPSPASPQAEAK